MTRGKFRISQAYDDLPPTAVIAARGGVTAPTLATFVSDIEQFTFDATNDFIIGAAELVPGYKEGSDLSVHVHWCTNGSEVGDTNVNFQMKYSVLIPNSAAGAQQTISSGNITITGGTADRYYRVSNIGTISGTGLVIGSYITFRFERIAATSGSAPAADPFVIAVGFHALMDSNGSTGLFTK